MGMSAFKKVIMLSSLVVIAVSANAQDREENGSLVSTRMRVNGYELRTWDDAQEDSSYSGIAKVAFDQLVTQPLQGALSTAEAFCKFAYQRPATALAITAAYALPVVAAAMGEREIFKWYPLYTCASTPDIKQLSPFNGTQYVTLNFAPVTAQGFTPYTGGGGYQTSYECSNSSMRNWAFPVPTSAVFGDAACSTLVNEPPSMNTYQWAQAYYVLETTKTAFQAISFVPSCSLGT